VGVHFQVLLLTLAVIFPPANAQTAVESMNISYSATSWNTDSTRVDSAYLIMRDRNSGKTVLIRLEESEPDSSKFDGQFSVTWGNKERIAPEVFVPPAELRNSTKGHKKLYEMIQATELQPKPTVWKKTEKNQPVLGVYDSREQAETALRTYQEEQRIQQEMKRKSRIKPAASTQSLAAAEFAEHKAKMERLALEAAKREAERVRLEQLEKERLAERLRQSRMATEQEKAVRREKAEKLARAALAFYNVGDYVNAEKRFKESVDMDPENRTYYFQYGISLYRNQKYNEALVVFRLAQVDDKSELERQYYIGLTHYRLNEFTPAVESFHKVADGKDPIMAPSALFYMGVIQFAQEKYENAKVSFETVIDTSKDPRLDEQAEMYLDRIASQMIFQKMREKKWTLTGTLGALYDSNVLLSTDSSSDQGSSTKQADWRLLTAGDAEFRPLFNEHHEWSVKGNAALINSKDDISASADPFIYNLSLPYSYKGVIGKKGLRLTAKPGYELLYMDPNKTGTKSQVLNSYILLLESTFVMSASYFATYNFEFRRDDSRLDSSIGDEDADANKYSLRTFHSVFLDKSRKEALVGNLGYVKNAAKGMNAAFNRIEAGASYVRPTRWNAAWNMGLSIYKLSFPDADPKRDDFNVTLSTGISKPIRDWVTWGLMGSYIKNDSNLPDSYEYDRWTITTTATFTTML
jgi:tetratricopeptide (TPR) repeat protein